jgi:ubiquinone/menaquinone biosynthesis C-methylase UbiE
MSHGQQQVGPVQRMHGKPGIRTPGELMGHGQARSYDLLSTVFFLGRRRRAFTRLAALSSARPGDRVLDVGCGTGYFTRVMAEAVAPGGTAVGIDPSPEVIARARSSTRLPNCTFAEGIAEALDTEDESYDVVVSSLMLHHLPETLRPQAIREMHRVLRPGGRVLVADFRPPTTRIGRLLLKGHVISPAMRTNPVHLLEPMVRDAGFQQIRGGDVQPWLRYVHAAKQAATP